MATLKVLNQYKAAYPDMSEQVVAALNLSTAVEMLLTNGTEPSLVQKIASGISVMVPDPVINVVCKVNDGGAGICKATPYTADDVANGDKVFCTAIAGEGYTFVGWYDENDTELSTEESLTYVVSYAGAKNVTLTLTAKFATL